MGSSHVRMSSQHRNILTAVATVIALNIATISYRIQDSVLGRASQKKSGPYPLSPPLLLHPTTPTVSALIQQVCLPFSSPPSKATLSVEKCAVSEQHESD